MAITKQKKQELIASYVEHLNNSHAVVLADYRGMSVQNFQTLRGKMREQGAKVQVVKNSLLELALKQADMPVPEEQLIGPLAIAYLPDDIATAAKALFEFAKEDDDTFTVTGAILEGQILNAEEARNLRNLPTRNTVMAQLLGAIQGPASELVRTIEAPANELYRTIQAPLRELALTIQSYADKGAEAGA